MAASSAVCMVTMACWAPELARPQTTTLIWAAKTVGLDEAIISSNTHWVTMGVSA